MKILYSNTQAPLVISPSKQARADVIGQLRALEKRSIEDQNSIGRISIEIGEGTGVTTTYWVRPVNVMAPKYLESSVGGIKRVFLLASYGVTRADALGVYEKEGPNWRRRAVIVDDTEIMAVLPKRVFLEDVSGAATANAKAALAKVLDLPVGSIGTLGNQACSRLIGGIVLEKVLPALQADLEAHLAGLPEPEAKENDLADMAA